MDDGRNLWEPVGRNDAADGTALVNLGKDREQVLRRSK